MNDSAFDSWYNGMVGFHINSERIYDDLCDENVPPELLRKWMAVCWNNAIEAAQQPESVCWNDRVYDDIEKLKEPLDKAL